MGRLSGLVVWLRSLPRTAVLTTCAALLVLTLAVLALLEAPVWVRVGGACLVALVAVLSEVDKHRVKQLERAAAELESQKVAAAAEQLWLRQIQDSLLFWPLPRNDTADWSGLGVRPSLGGTGVDGSDSYVPRDVEAAATLRLRERGVLLLVGEPGSGLTRTAAELLRATRPIRQVLAPRPPAGLERSLNELDVLERLEPQDRLVVWLDRLHDHDGGIVSLLKRCREAASSGRVIATLGSTRYQRWATEQPELAAYLGDPIRVKRLPSPRELAAANALYSGRDFELDAPIACQAAVWVGWCSVSHAR